MSVNPEKGETSKVIPTLIPVVCLGNFPTTGLGGEEQAVTEVQRWREESPKWQEVGGQGA